MTRPALAVADISYVNFADTAVLTSDTRLASYITLPARVMPADMLAILGLSGQRFGRLTALFVHDKKQDGRTLWVCRCDCGTVRPVLAGSLLRSHSTSCGCTRREKLVARQTTHGHAVNGRRSAAWARSRRASQLSAKTTPATMSRKLQIGNPVRASS